MLDGLRRAGRVGRVARATRAYLAGIGTSGSLLAIAALLFIMGSALVGFRGWPHVGAQPSPGEVVISPPATASASASVLGRRLAVIAATGTHGAAGAPATGAGGRTRSGTALGAAPPTTRASLGTPVSTSRPVSGGGAGGGGSAPRPGCALSGCGTPAPGSGPGPITQVQRTVGQVAGTLGSIVSGAGGTVGTAVQQTTGSVGGAVEPVSPPVGGAVSSTGTAAGNTITGATQTIAGALQGLTHH